MNKIIKQHSYKVVVLLIFISGFLLYIDPLADQGLIGVLVFCTGLSVFIGIIWKLTTYALNNRIVPFPDKPYRIQHIQQLRIK